MLKYKRYLKYLKVIAGLSGSSLLVAYHVNETCKSVNRVVQTNVLEREKKSIPEYIYVDDPVYDIRMRREMDLQQRWFPSVTRWWKKLKKSIAWRLLWLCRNGNKEQRARAVEQLAAIRKMKDWDVALLSQAMDARTAVALARTPGSDLRLQRLPPHTIHEMYTATKIKDMLVELGNQTRDHDCVRRFVSKYFGSVHELVVEPGSDVDLHTASHGPNDRELSLLTMQAVLHHLDLCAALEDEDSSMSTMDKIKGIFKGNIGEKKTTTEVLASTGALLTLALVLRLYGDDPECKMAVAKLLCHLSQQDRLLQDFFQMGLVGHLATWLRSSDVRLSSTAGACLANLDEEHGAKYAPDLYLLHPLYRTRESAKCDVVFVHGLLGGVFVTWRQRDRISSSANKEVTAAIGKESEISPHDTSKPDQPPPELHSSSHSTRAELISALEDLETRMEDFELVMHDTPVSGRREAGHHYLCDPNSHVHHDEENDKKSDTICWPKDWLPRDCKNVRVIGVNYWTSLSSWSGGMCVPPRARTLRSRARRALGSVLGANVGKVGREAVWVSHSMGGLIVKQMLVDSWQSSEPISRELSENTRGLVFYSTPHRGSPLASIQRTVAAILWPTVEVQELKEDAPHLLSLNEDFVKATGDLGWNVLSFAEASPTLLSPWRISVQFVGLESADLGTGEFYELPLDHLCICKPATRHSFLYVKTVDLVRHTVHQPCSDVACSCHSELARETSTLQIFLQLLPFFEM